MVEPRVAHVARGDARDGVDDERRESTKRRAVLDAERVERPDQQRVIGACVVLDGAP